MRVRIAKIFLRFVNFGCSLIVLAILGTTLSIFNATKSLPSRNNLPAWAEGTNPWAQWVLLGVSCVSLLCCLLVFYGYFKGGHKLAQKYAFYYSILSVCFFGFNLIMWVVAAGVYQSSKSNGNNQDMWGWSCSQNLREELFHSDINYALMCRLQVSHPSLYRKKDKLTNNPGLGPRLRHHRNRPRSPRDPNLRRGPLPLHNQTPPDQSHGPTR